MEEKLMEIKILEGEAFTIALVGRLDTVTSTELVSFYNGQEVKEGLVVMDMQELEYISSAGLRALLYIKKDLAEKGKSFEIHNLNNICKEVFKVTGFGNILTVK